LTLPQAERFVQGRRDGSRVNRVQQRLHPSQRQTRSLSAFIDPPRAHRGIDTDRRDLRRQHRPAATTRPTPCSPSSKPSEYAEHPTTTTSSHQGLCRPRPSTRHNPGLGIFSFMPNSA
jgi:hypothetical protein